MSAIKGIKGVTCKLIMTLLGNTVFEDHGIPKASLGYDQ
jgi:uncharacterized protein YozE (UPF0346 family)